MTYVYRLHVTVPHESLTDPAWRPEGYDTWDSYQRIIDDYEVWRWPQANLYLSASGAEKRAVLLRRMGATVRIERSLVVEWALP